MSFFAPILLEEGGDLDLALGLDEFDDAGKLIGPLDLTGCTLDFVTNTLPFTPSLTLTNAAAGEGLLAITAEQIATLEKGEYRSRIRITDTGGKRHLYPWIVWTYNG